MMGGFDAAGDAPNQPSVDAARAVTIDADARSCRRYARRMNDLGLSADFLSGSIERYRLTELERHRTASFVDRDVAALIRSAVRVAAAPLPEVYQDSLFRLGIEERLHGPIISDLQALIRRAGSEEPQSVLSMENIKAEIAYGLPVRRPEMRVVNRRHVIRLLRYDLVAANRRHDVMTMVEPARLASQLASFLRKQPDDRLRRAWRPYLVFLESQDGSFAVSDDLFDGFRTWLRQRRWQESSIAILIKALMISIRTANRHDAYGVRKYRRYHDSETILTEPMISALETFQRRLGRGEHFPIHLGPGSIRNTLIDFCKVCRKAGHDPDVTVVTVNVYLSSLSQREIGAGRIRMAQRALRLYCECSGTGTAWLQMEAYNHQHPTNDPVLLSECVRRKFERFVKHVRLGRICFAECRVRGLELLLGRLLRFCRIIGLPEDLSEKTLSAYFTSLNRSIQKKSGGCMQSLIRVFLQDCDPHNPWLLSSRSPRGRTLEQILAQKHWGHLRGQALIALEQGIKPYGLRSLDPILAYASTHQVVSPGMVLSLAGRGVAKLGTMTRTLQVIDPKSDLLFVIRSAIVLVSRQGSNFNIRTNREARSYESLLAKCPSLLRAKIAPMTVTDLRGNRALPVHSVRVLSFVARNLEAVARKKGFGPFSAQAYRALIVELAASSRRASTIVHYLAAMAKIAFLLKLPPEAGNEVRRYRSRFRACALREGTLKGARLRSQTVTIEDMATAACKARRDALDPSRTERSAQTRRGSAAAIAIWTALPLRVCEMQRLVLGVSLIRRDDAWHVSLLTSKAHVMVDRMLPYQVTPHIDLLLMRGSCDVTDRNFQAAYVSQEGLPLFRNRHGAALCHTTFKNFLGRYVSATPHMVRTLVRDKMSIHGAFGDKISSYQLGHRSHLSGRYYEVFADGIRAAEADRMVHAVSWNGDRLVGVDRP